MRRDFTENSNDSYWMTNPAHPLTGFPRVVGEAGLSAMGAAGADIGLRTRDALTKIMGRISGTDGLGPPGFTLAAMKNLFYADTQYGATLVKTQLVHMCRSFPGGRAPTSTGTTIPVGGSCHVLAAWNGTENPGSRGALLFQAFWCPFEIASKSPGALCRRSPWTHPFLASDPVHTPYGLNTASAAVQKAFGDALAAMQAAHLPYGVPLGAVQYITLNGRQIPLPGGPADPNGELNAIYQFSGPGSVPAYGSSYVQAVTWQTGNPCPQAATVLTFSESGNPASAHYNDQTELFSQRKWVTADFCPGQVAAHATSTTVLRGR